MRELSRREWIAVASGSLFSVALLGTTARPHGPRLDDPDWVDRPFPVDPEDADMKPLGPNDGPFPIPDNPNPGPFIIPAGPNPRPR